MTAPAKRLQASFALALLAHLALPAAVVVIARWQPDAAAPAGDDANVALPKLPQGGLQMQYQLGDAGKQQGQRELFMPEAKPQGKLAMSLSLGQADQQAVAAAERAQPTSRPPGGRFVAEVDLQPVELSLIAEATAAAPEAGAVLAVPPPVAEAEKKPAPKSSAKAEPKVQPKSEPKPAPKAAARSTAAKPTTPAIAPKVPETPRPALPEPAWQQALADALKPKNLPTSPPKAALPPPPQLASPAPTERWAPSSSVKVYAGGESEIFAEVPADAAGDERAPPVTAGTQAPERGPGETTSNKLLFISKLEAKLRDASARALAEAVKAGPRVRVDVAFTIDRSGRVINAWVPKTSGDLRLDDKAIAVVRRASPMPQLPPDMPPPRVTFSYPIEIYR